MLADVLQRQEGVVGILVVQHRVPMEEGAAPAVLAAEADREAVLDERRTGERLGAAPVERLLAGEHLLAVGDDLSDARMERKARRNAGDALAQGAQTPQLDPGLHALGPIRVAVGTPVHRVLVADHAQRGARLRAPLVQAAAVLLDHRGRLRL